MKVKSAQRIKPFNGDENCVAGIPLAAIVSLELIRPELLQAAFQEQYVGALKMLYGVDEDKQKHKKAVTRLISQSAILIFWGVIIGCVILASTWVLFLSSNHQLSKLEILLIAAVSTVGMGFWFSALIKNSNVEGHIDKLSKLLADSEPAAKLRELDNFAITSWCRYRRFRTAFFDVGEKPHAALMMMEAKECCGIIGLSLVAPIEQIKQYFRLGLDLIVYEIVSELAKDRMADVSALREELKQADLLLCDFRLIDFTVSPSKRWDEMFQRMEALYEQNHPKGQPEPIITE